MWFLLSFMFSLALLAFYHLSFNQGILNLSFLHGNLFFWVRFIVKSGSLNTFTLIAWLTLYYILYWWWLHIVLFFEKLRDSAIGSTLVFFRFWWRSCVKIRMHSFTKLIYVWFNFASSLCRWKPLFIWRRKLLHDLHSSFS